MARQRFRPGLLACAVALAAQVGIQSEAVMAGDQPLRETLVLRVTQTGFAGETGTEYVVEPNGEWQARDFVNERIVGEVTRGSLSASDMIALSHQLRAIELTEASQAERSAGTLPPVNPAFLELRYGDERTTAPLPEGATLDACPDANAQHCQLIELARTVASKAER